MRARAAIAIATIDSLRVQWLIDPEVGMVANFRVFSKLLQRAIAAPEHITSGQECRVRGAKGG